MPHVQNGQFVPGSFSQVQTTAGTTQADASPQLAGCFYIPTVSAAGAGVILKVAPAQAWGIGANHDTSLACVVYPPVGVKFNGATANLGVTLPPRSSFWYFWFDAANCSIVVGNC